MLTPLKFGLETLEAMKLLHRNSHMTQLLIVLYSAIDTLAWLGTETDEVNRTAFKDWVDSYYLPDSKLQCTSDDLYGARCGLLHSHTAESRSSVRGQARQIWYYSGERSRDYLTNEIGERTDVVPVRVLDLIEAFASSLARFSKDLNEDPARAARAVKRASLWLRWSEPAGLNQ